LVANVTSRRFTVQIGGQDWSRSAKRLTVGFKSLSEEGLLKFSGSLYLQSDNLAPESLNPRVNPSRWRPGQSVYVQVVGDNGVFRDFQFSHLVILEEPDPLKRSDSLQQIEVGCWLNWSDTYEFDGDESGVFLGVAEPSQVVAQRLLQTHQIPANRIALGTWSYDLAYPASKQGESSYVQQAGGLAVSNDWRYLYQRTNGQITQGQLNLSPAVAPAVTVNLGTNDRVWEPLKDPQSPVETIRVAAIGYPLDPFENWTDIDEVIDDLSNYSPTTFGNGVVRRVLTSMTYDYPNTITKRVVTWELEATVFLRVTIPAQLIIYEEMEEVKRFNSTYPHRLESMRTSVERTERAIIYDGILSNDREVLRIDKDWDYDENDTVISTDERTKEAQILHEPETERTARWNMRDVHRLLIEYEPLGGGNWKKKERESTARVILDSAVDKFSSNPWAMQTETRLDDGDDGDVQPPKTQYFEPANTKEEHYESDVTWIHPGGATGRNRKRLFTVPFGFNQEQVTGIAEQFRGLLVGRHRGDLIELPVSDAVLSADPMFRVNVVEPDGTTHRYLGDGLSYTLEETKAYAACAGIWLDSV